MHQDSEGLEEEEKHSFEIALGGNTKSNQPCVMTGRRIAASQVGSQAKGRHQKDMGSAEGDGQADFPGCGELLV